jgi:cystathionine beta-lyase/cystathionine gamma-synthase
VVVDVVVIDVVVVVMMVVVLVLLLLSRSRMHTLLQRTALRRATRVIWCTCRTIYTTPRNFFARASPNCSADTFTLTLLPPLCIEQFVFKLFYAETISNPSYAVPDFEGIAKICAAKKCVFVVDNTFGMCGYTCRPFKFGANVVVESCTKWIGGW